MSNSFITEAAREYRANLKPSTEPPATVIANDARIGFLFDLLWDATRHAIAAKVALGAEDFDLAHASLGALVADVKTAASMWNALRRDSEEVRHHD